MYLLNNIEGNASVFLNLMVCHFAMEVDIMRQDKYLFDICAGDLIIDDLCIVVADGNKLPDNCANNKQRAGVHTGNGIVNNHDLVFHYLATLTAPNKIVKIQECYKVTLALAQVFCNRSVLTNNLIDICYSGLFTETEALKARISKQGINTVDCSFGIYSLLVQLGDFFRECP